MRYTVMVLILLILICIFVVLLVPPRKHEIQRGVGYIGERGQLYQFLGDTTTTTKEKALHKLDSLAEIYGGVWVLHTKQFSLGE